jgi:hypothetical protein
MEKKAHSRVMELLPERRVRVGQVHLLVSGLALGVFSWSLVSFVKRIPWQNFSLDIKPWALLFFHPLDAALANYLALCLFTAAYALIIYKKGVNSFLSDNSVVWQIERLILLPVLSTCLLICSLALPLGWRLLALAVASATPAIYSLNLPNPGSLRTLPTRGCRPISVAPAPPTPTTHSLNSLKLNSIGTSLISIGPWFLFAIVSLEPLLVVKGPAYVMNEYQHLYSTTIIDAVSLNNEAFLEQVTETQAAAFLSRGKKAPLRYVRPFT